MLELSVPVWSQVKLTGPGVAAPGGDRLGPRLAEAVGVGAALADAQGARDAGVDQVPLQRVALVPGEGRDPAADDAPGPSDSVPDSSSAAPSIRVEVVP